MQKPKVDAENWVPSQTCWHRRLVGVLVWIYTVVPEYYGPSLFRTMEDKEKT